MYVLLVHIGEYSSVEMFSVLFVYTNNLVISVNKFVNNIFIYYCS
jgi:hypothetical protein